MGRRIAVVGLGYVGLPVALGLARKFPGTIGFDINESRVQELNAGVDRTGESTKEEILGAKLTATSDPSAMKGCDFFVIAVPTPIDDDKRPDLTALERSSETVGKVLSRGSIVVYESTVYPGVTEEICGPILAKVSGLVQGKDFKLGYSPERINPGDREHTLERVIKVVAGEDAETLDTVASVYGAVVTAGVHRAPTIKVAEAAKVIENTQRDLNIALMNELSLIFDLMGISTRDVLAAAGTKWNFLKFFPGLVGGHCIGVDPYYLTTKAEQLGYIPEVILAGRRINDTMGQFVARRLVKLLVRAGTMVKDARVAVLGLSFKENISDIRNSRVPDIIRELREFSIEPLLHDPYADPHEVKEEYNLTLSPWEKIKDLDAVILAVSHQSYLDLERSELMRLIRPNGVLIDVKGIVKPNELRSDVAYWSL